LANKGRRWKLRYKGRPFGRRTYYSEREVIAAWLRMYPVMQGLGWMEVRDEAAA